MKPIILTAAALLGAAASPALAKGPKTVLVPITYDHDVPVPCADEPLHTCHNRWHPDIPPAAFANPGDTVIFETRDAFDNPFNRDTVPSEVAAANLNLIHPLTGPLYVHGAQPGDVLEVTMVDVEPGPDRFGYTVAVPGFGFLRDVFTDPAIVHWELGTKGGSVAKYATSRDLPGVRLPLHGFAGTIGVELGPAEILTAFAREEQLAAKGGFVLPPEPTDAVPASVCGKNGSAKSIPCLRTIPPRENGGNTDVKQMVKGTTLLFPCFVPGCGLSVGDVHWAQGDGEVSGTAIEMNAVVTVKVAVRHDSDVGGAAKKIGNWPMFGSSSPGVLRDLEPDQFLATMGIPVKDSGVVMVPEKWIDDNSNHLLRPLQNESEDVTLAARDALLKMIGLISGPVSPSSCKLNAVQAYLLCSVACDLKISNLVDVPNYVVSDFLPIDVFDHGARCGK